MDSEGEEATFFTPSLPFSLGFEGLFKKSNRDSSLAPSREALLVLEWSVVKVLLVGGGEDHVREAAWELLPTDLPTDWKERGGSGSVDKGCALGS